MFGRHVGRLGVRGLKTQAFVEHVPKSFSNRRVRDVVNIDEMGRKFPRWTIEEDETVLNATRAMVERHTGCLCVTRKGKVKGIITERDYLTKVLHSGRTSDKTLVKEIATMDEKLIKAAPDDLLQDCVELMVYRNIRHLPIDENGQVVALIGIEDIAKALADERTVTLRTLYDLRTAHQMPIHDG